MYVALKVFYLGERFYGAVRQPNLPTVQEELENALKMQGIEARVKFTSRTDRGVSAIDNVAYYRGKAPEVGLLNVHMRDVLAWGVYEGPERPIALKKTYLYVIPEPVDPDRFLGAIEKSFRWEGICKGGEGSPKAEPEVRVEVEGPITLVWFSSSSFCWQMIRRSIGYALSLIHGTRFSVAPPDGLVLVKTQTNVNFSLKPRWLALLEERVKKLMWKCAGSYGIYKGLTSSGLLQSLFRGRTTLFYP